MPTVYNKVTYNAATLLSLETDTITAADLRQGVTAHDATGQAIVGTYSPSGVNLQSKTKSYTPSATAQSETVTADSGYDGLSSVAISVGAIPQGESDIDLVNASFYDDNGVRKWRVRAGVDVWDGWLPAGEYYGEYRSRNAVAANTTITPSLTAQTVGGANWMMEGPVTVAAMPVSGTINIDDSGDWDVTYARTASVPAGTEGTPSATKGTVSNHAVSVTPSVTNSAGWIDGGTKTGSAVTVSASELVSGTLSVTSSGTKDVTTYASASIPAGTAGTPTATKGSVSNHSISVTPSVTNSTGFITGSTKSGTAVTVSASELVSGTLSISQNGTQDVTNYASVNVAIPIVTYYTGTSTPASNLGQNGDIYLKAVN